MKHHCGGDPKRTVTPLHVMRREFVVVALEQEQSRRGDAYEDVVARFSEDEVSVTIRSIYMSDIGVERVFKQLSNGGTIQE